MATLSYYHIRATTGFNIDVFGVVDGVTGESDWTAAGLLYPNAPGFSGTFDVDSVDRDHNAGETVLLGSVIVTGTGTHSLSNAALADFLNADSNGVVTFILEPEVAAIGEDFNQRMSSAEEEIVSQRPKLEVSNQAPVPPPESSGVQNWELLR